MIFHLCEFSAWQEAKIKGFYEAESLKTEGFIHLSSFGQMLTVANNFYKKAVNPVLLALDQEILGGALKWEGNKGLKFPHLYRKIQLTEVLSTVELNRNLQGEFVDSAEIRKEARAVLIPTERLLLRELHLSDFQAVHSYASDSSILDYMIWGPNNDEQTGEYLTRAFQLQTENPREEYTLAILILDSSELIGAISLTIDSFTHQVGSIGYILNQKFHGKGFATEACKAIINFGFEKLDLYRLQATCDEKNLASLNVMKKSGLAYEGLLKGHQLIKNRRRNTVVCGVVNPLKQLNQY